MYLKQLSLAALCCVAMLACGTANAAVVLTEDFSYADGALVGNGGWVNHSGTPGTLLVSGGAAVVTEDGGSEDANTAFSGVFTSGVLSASFDISVTAPAAIVNADDEYFAHFYPSDDGFGFRARTFVHAPTAGGDYTLSISTSSSSTSVDLPTDFSFGDTVPVTISFDLDAGTASITAGGNTVGDATVSAGQSIDAFALRQSTHNVSLETIVVDNLRVEHTAIPEPTSIVLLFAGLLGMGAVRRK